MLHSRTNFDPAQHSGPAWDNILADNLLDIGVEVPDCLSDLDGDNDTDGADLARLLGAGGSPIQPTTSTATGSSTEPTSRSCLSGGDRARKQRAD